MEGENLVADFEVGQRVQSIQKAPGKQPQVGTVRYIGSVDGYEGQWIGVDWDNGQGRHNGSVDGRVYFQTQEATSGSFVRPHNLVAGVSLIEALSHRYNAAESPNGPEQDDCADDMYVLSIKHRRLPVELVGKTQIEARQKQLQNLHIATLAYTGVSSAGPAHQIRALVPNIKELDLTGNLLPDWRSVGDICAELSSLEVLNLSCSRLKSAYEIPLQTQLKIKTLVLNNCQITWPQLEALKKYLGFIEELHLCGNKLSKIERNSSTPLEIVEGFGSLRLLNLEDNNFGSWEEIAKLAYLESLEHLNLNSNEIREVSHAQISGEVCESQLQKSGGQVAIVPFQSLRCLLLGKNKIADSASIDALDKFPNLHDLRLSENPVTTTAAGGAPRYILVARVHKLTSLNGSEIKPRERRDAEIRYVRHLLSTAAGKSTDELEKLHPRLREFRLRHDVPVESVHQASGLSSQKMSATLISINFTCVASSVGEKPPSVKRLPASTTVGKVKQICESSFKLRAAEQRLFIKDDVDPVPVSLDNDLETLDDLGVRAGATILVDDSS